LVEEFPLNPNVELLKWGPIQARLYFIIDFIEAVNSAYYKGSNAPYRWPKGLLLFKGNTHLWINEFPSIWEVGKRALLEVIMDDSKRIHLRKEYDLAVSEITDFEEKIKSINLSKCTDKELCNLLDTFNILLINFWGPALIPEIANYGSVKYFEGELRKEDFSDNKIKEIIQVLTAPEKLSFYQEEEIDLFNSNNIKEHRDKYFWIKNSYGAVFDLDEDFFIKRKLELKSNLPFEIENFLKETKSKKLELIKKYSVPDKFVKIANMIALCINWQDERKAVIEKYLHFKELLLKEVVLRKKIDFDDLLNFSSKEVIKILLGKDVSGEILLRRKGFAVITDPFKIVHSPRSDEFWEIYSAKVDVNVKEFKGIVASKGVNPIVNGRVKIVKNPHEVNGFKEGSILVASMTSPEFIYLMRKSIAIITDEGGLTSHAAIVSRELKVPCIVGCKVATKVLHDGDLVEIDTNKGVVKIIKRN